MFKQKALLSQTIVRERDSMKKLNRQTICRLAKMAFGCLIVALSTWVSSVADEAQVSFVGNGQQLNNFVGRGVALADFNGDGSLDACVVNESGPNGLADIRIYFGDGRGQFIDSGQRLERRMGAVKPVVFDIDGNGTRDVITGRTAWLNDGHGRFLRTPLVLWISDGAMLWQCRPADLNGDGLMDLFAITRMGQETKARVYLNDKKGHFQYSGQPLGQGILAAVELGDVNGDGFMDAVMSGWRNTDADPCPNRVLLNDGLGHFAETGQFFDEGLRHSHGLALGDFDRDGDLDFVLVTQGPPQPGST